MVNLLEKSIRQAKTNMKKNIPQEYSRLISRATDQHASNLIPHGFVKQLVAEATPVCPWLTYNTMMNFHRKQVKLGSAAEIPIALVDTSNENVAASTERKKGGRPLLGTYKRKRDNNLAVVATTNEIKIAFGHKKH